MKTSYYLRNNPLVVMGIIDAVLQSKGSADIGRIAVFLPMLLDDKVVGSLLDNSLQYSFRQLVQQNNMYLANYNDRYLSLLMPLYHALCIMMDADAIRMNGATIEPSANLCKVRIEASSSKRLQRINKAVEKLFAIAEKESNKELYQVLKVAL